MPDNKKSVDQMLADAKSTLQKANTFPSATPAHEYSNASYSMAKTKPAPTGIEKEAGDTGTSINYNMKQRHAVNQVLDKVGQ